MRDTISRTDKGNESRNPYRKGKAKTRAEYVKKFTA